MSALEQRVVVAPLAHRFGLRPDFSLGVEDELLIVDPTGRHLEADASRVIRSARTASGSLSSEIFAAQVELVTPVCRTVMEASASLKDLLGSVQATGATVIGAGLHPLAGFGSAPLMSSPRYEKVSEALQGLLRTPPAGLHVHVGMRDPESAIRACNGMRRHLALLHSLAANSPFWYGRDSGLASSRAAILRSYPRYGAPRWFAGWDDFSTLAHELARAAGVEDYTHFWWEVRPHPRLGTLEVRAPDAQFSVQRTVALVALIHALSVAETEGPPPPYQARDAVEEACYQATRYGLDARLPDDEGSLRPARELAYRVLKRTLPYARELGCEDALLGVEQILLEGNGADVQRRVHRRGGTAGLLEWLVRQRQTR